MEFKIKRTSMFDYEKPCEEAYKKKQIIHANNFECQHFHRQFNDEIWCIKINSLEELLELQDKYGEIILSTSFKMRVLEIYDDYRE